MSGHWFKPATPCAQAGELPGWATPAQLLHRPALPRTVITGAPERNQLVDRIGNEPPEQVAFVGRQSHGKDRDGVAMLKVPRE